ncbi:MAG: radical SAM protein, partial [bacterium]|nr:radical SAM protein [bacterium]
IDEEIETIDFDEFFDLIGITALTPKAARAYEIAEEFRRRGVYVIMGGPHASVLPREAQKFVDSVFVGEAQLLWDRFMKDFKQGNPRPLYDTKGVFADMKKSPVPRYDLLNIGCYRVVPIETTRGCPHDCEFCSSTRLWGRFYRSKSVRQVLTEVKEIKRVAPRKFLFFVDDNMFVKRNFSYDLLNALVPLKVRWFTQTD